MSYTVQFKFEVTVGSDTIEYDQAIGLATGVAKKTFGNILFEEFSDPEAFLN